MRYSLPTAISRADSAQFHWATTRAVYRSKFNTALGIEAQGFCVLK